MESKEFVKRVQDQAGLAAPDEAVAAIEAVLGTLGEMLSPLERRHLAARSDVRHLAAMKHSQAVMKVLREAVPPGELADIVRELPDEYEELLTGTVKSPASPSIAK